MIKHERAGQGPEFIERELGRMSGYYGALAIKEAQKHIDLLLSLHNAWEDALAESANNLDVPRTEEKDTPFLLESHTVDSIGSKPVFSGKTVVGIAGPGAVGKETLARALSIPKVINTTTRSPRNYEEDHVHYHFVSDEQFDQIENAGEFINVVDRSGRGRYGMQHRDLDRVLSTSDVAMIEENPDNLRIIAGRIETIMPETIFEAAYILPPSPVVLHLASRLARRCLHAGEDFQSTAESTLGSRQIKEFTSYGSLARSDTRAFYVVNDDIDRATSVIRSTLPTI